jgi:uncharacterized protein
MSRLPVSHEFMKERESHLHSDLLPCMAIGGRIDGYDLARAMAIFAMMVINFKCVFTENETDPVWLFWLVERMEGRAAATFAVVAGVGLSLLSRRARIANDKAGISNHRYTLLKRAVFLFIIGMAFTYTWPADILHYYGLYICIGAFFLMASDRQLLTMATISITVFIVLMAMFDYGQGWDGETADYEGLWTPAGMIRNLFFNGYYPVFPWTSFIFVGMWLGRQDVADHGFRRKMILLGIGLVCFAESAAWQLSRILSKTYYCQVNPDLILSFKAVSHQVSSWIETGPFPPSLPYMISGLGTAFAVIMVSIMLAEKFAAAPWIRPVIAAGRLSLTLYVAHVVIGINILEMLELGEDQTILFSVGCAVAFYACAVPLSLLWLKRFKRGPLEWLMRKFSDFNIKTTPVSRKVHTVHIR